MLLDFFSWIGWAYDLKSVPSHIVKQRVKRSGDGTWMASYGGGAGKDDNLRDENSKEPQKSLWGWGDDEMTQEDYKIAEIYKPSLKTVDGNSNTYTAF